MSLDFGPPPRHPKVLGIWSPIPGGTLKSGYRFGHESGPDGRSRAENRCIMIPGPARPFSNRSRNAQGPELALPGEAKTNVDASGTFFQAISRIATEYSGTISWPNGGCGMVRERVFPYVSYYAARMGYK